jgi:hypothetical protein
VVAAESPYGYPTLVHGLDGVHTDPVQRMLVFANREPESIAQCTGK